MKEDTQLAEDRGKTMETQNLACRRKAEPKQVQMVSEASVWGHRAVRGPGVLQTPRKTAAGTGVLLVPARGDLTGRFEAQTRCF